MIAESVFFRNRSDRLVGLSEVGRCGMDPGLEDELPRREPGQLEKLPVQLALGNAETARKIGDAMAPCGLTADAVDGFSCCLGRLPGRVFRGKTAGEPDDPDGVSSFLEDRELGCGKPLQLSRVIEKNFRVINERFPLLHDSAIIGNELIGDGRRVAIVVRGSGEAGVAGDAEAFQKRPVGVEKPAFAVLDEEIGVRKMVEEAHHRHAEWMGNEGCKLGV